MKYLKVTFLLILRYMQEIMFHVNFVSQSCSNLYQKSLRFAPELKQT